MQATNFKAVAAGGKMMQIKFSHNYPKIWGQKRAQLITVRLLDCQGVAINKVLLEYDTYWNNEWGCAWLQELELERPDGYYELPKTGKLIQLVFLGDRDIPFCTLRRFTPEKFEYYRNLARQVFEVIIDE
jgi:hypothetical protein